MNFFVNTKAEERLKDLAMCNIMRSKVGRKDLELMYAHLFREHQELQRAFTATRITLGQIKKKDHESRRGSESPKWDYSDIHIDEEQNGTARQLDARNLSLENKLERLRLRNMALESELQDVHDQNELLEFRLLELEECQGNKRRDVHTEMEGFDQLSDSGNGSLLWSGDTSVSIRISYKEDSCSPTFIHSKIHEYKSHLRSMVPRLAYHEDKALLHQTVAILEACQLTIDRLEKATRNVTRVQVADMKADKFQESGIFDESLDPVLHDFSGQTDFEDIANVMKEIDALRKFKKSVEVLRITPVLPLLLNRTEAAVQADFESSDVEDLTSDLQEALSEKQLLASQLGQVRLEVNNLLEKLGAAEVALVNTVNQLETEVCKKQALIDYVEELKQEVFGAFYDIGIEKSDESDIWCVKSDIEALRACLKLYAGSKANDRVSIYIKDSLANDLSNNNVDQPINKELENYYLEQIESLQKEKISLRRSFEEEKHKLVHELDECAKNLRNSERQIEDYLERLHKSSETIRQFESEKCKTNSASEDRIRFLEAELRQLDDFYRSEITTQKQAFLKDYEELYAKQNESQLKVNKLRDLLNEVCQELEFDMIKNPDTTNHFSSISEVLFDDSCGEVLVERVRNLLHEESALRQKNIDLERKERAYRETLQEADAIMARVEEQHKAELRNYEENERQLQEKVNVLSGSEKRLRSLLQEKENGNSDELAYQLKACDQLIGELRQQLAELEHVNAELNFKLIDEQEQNQSFRNQETESLKRMRQNLKECEEINRQLSKQLTEFKEGVVKLESKDDEIRRLKTKVEDLEHQNVIMKRSLTAAEVSLRQDNSKLTEIAGSRKRLEVENAALTKENKSLRESLNKKLNQTDSGADSEEASLRAEISKLRNQHGVAQSQMQELELINCVLREDQKRIQAELERARELLKRRTSGVAAEVQTDEVIEGQAEPRTPTPVISCPNCSGNVSSFPTPRTRPSSEEILEDIALTEKFIDDIFGSIEEPKPAYADFEALKADMKEKETILEVLDTEAKLLTTRIQEKETVIRDLETNLLSTCKENERLKSELDAVRTSVGKSLEEASYAKQTLERRRATVGRSSSFSGVRTPRERPRSVRYEPKSIEDRVNEKKTNLDVMVPSPTDFKVTRRVGDDGLVVAWMPPDSDLICGYVICANDLEVQRVRSADRTKAVLYNLPTAKILTLTIQSTTKSGSSSKPASVCFNPDLFEDESKRS